MIKRFSLFVLVCSLASCGGNSTETTSTNPTPTKDSVKPESVTQPENELADFKFHTLVLNIPSPFEVIGLLPKAGLTFDKSLINSTQNESKYLTSTKRALNYGAYGVDLVYLSTNEQYDEVKNYFKTTRSLALSLDAAESFDKITKSKLEKPMDNKDTINKVMDQVYQEMDGYLRSNDRLLTATQILVGSWVESQYITLGQVKDIAKDKNNEILFQKVLESRDVLHKLTGLLKEYEKEKEFKSTINDMNDLDKIYADIKQGDPDKVLLNKIYDKLKTVRGKLVN